MFPEWQEFCAACSQQFQPHEAVLTSKLKGPNLERYGLHIKCAEPERRIPEEETSWVNPSPRAQALLKTYKHPLPTSEAI